MVIQAASEIGLASLTMQSVAERLGVSVTGLYHYVDGRDDLLRLAAQRSAERRRLPSYRGQHWAVWLVEWFEYSRGWMVEEPGALKQLLDSGMELERMVDTLELALDGLVRSGFSPEQALDAYRAVSEAAVGSAAGVVSQQGAATEGRGRADGYRKVLEQRGADACPVVRRAIAVAEPASPLARSLLLVLRGLAAERREPWGPVEKRLRRSAVWTRP
jgi:AcrR family transcriptional regulator